MIQSQQPVVEAFFDQTTNTISYVAFDPQTSCVCRYRFSFGF